MSLISITNLTFSYDGSYDDIFDNVSFQIDTNWKLGFTGRNGKGKTTFLRLLLGEYEYRGNISASVEFEYFPYSVPDGGMNTNEIIREIYSDYQDWELSRELSLLEVAEDVLTRPFDTLSKGEQTKVLLAALFLKENSFLLIDEPTNHLDMAARTLVSEYLKGKKGFILVSHDRVFLDNCIDHILSINKANIEIQRGNFSTWLMNKESQDKFELAENEKLKKDVKRLAASAKRVSDWSFDVEATKYASKNGGSKPADRGFIGHKAAKTMKRSKSIETRRSEALAEKSKLLKNIETVDSLKISPLSYHNHRFIALEDVSIFYGDKTVCKGISFEINQGDRIALCGKNGSGKSSLIKLVCGETMTYCGKLHIGSNLVISYVSQDASHLSGNLKDYAILHGLEESLFKAILRKLGFSRVQFEKDMEDFSAGQKKKVLIAGSLCEKAHLYIWDEPLNFLDVISRMQIEELLLQFKPTVLFVEHDSAFCENISTKKIVL